MEVRHRHEPVAPARYFYLPRLQPTLQAAPQPLAAVSPPHRQAYHRERVAELAPHLHPGRLPAASVGADANLETMPSRPSMRAASAPASASMASTSIRWAEARRSSLPSRF